MLASEPCHPVLSFAISLLEQREGLKSKVDIMAHEWKEPEFEFERYETLRLWTVNFVKNVLSLLDEKS
jgi:hypothetical protein